MSYPLIINVETGKITEPVSKLIDSVSAAVSGYARPHQIRRVAAAESEALIIQTKAEIESTELRYRAAARLGYLEIRRQQIIESIISKAMDQLPETVSDQPVDEDWIFQFFDTAKDVGNQEMQELWARILAGEVSEPGSFAPRTLNLVSLLKPDDAFLFSRLCNYVSDDFFILRHWKIDDYLKLVNLPYGSLIHLQSLGLVSIDPDAEITFPSDKHLHQMSYGDKTISFKKRSSAQECHLLTYVLTEMGNELYPLTEPKPDYEYLDLLIESYHDDFEVHENHDND